MHPRMIIDGQITLEGLTDKQKSEIKKGLSIRNPLYYRLKKMGNRRALYACPEYIKYYVEDKKTGALYVPRGVAGRVGEFLRRNGIPCTVVDERVVPQHDDPHRPKHGAPLLLRQYQEGIPELITRHEHGVVKLGTGFGKSIIALKVAELLQTPTLILAPRSYLVTQYKNEIEKYYGFTPSTTLDCADTPIVVCTIQGVQRKLTGGNLDPALKRRFGLLIVDECHLTVPTKSRDAVQWFHARYRYGLSATPERTDGQGEAISFIYGDTLVEDALPQEKPSVELKTFHGRIPMGEYGYIIGEQIKDRVRNRLIASTALQEIQAGRRVLILTKRIEHFDLLHYKLRELAPEGTDGYFAIRSTGSEKDRAALLDSFRDGTARFSCLLGTFGLLGTGVDIPSLDTLIVAGDLKSSVLTTQATGRILRLFEGKQSPKIIDIVDAGNPILLVQAKARQKFYTKAEWPIITQPNL